MPRAYVKHGFTGMPEYVAWKHMKARCHNSNHPEFHNYGGRGIFVCQEWREDFEAFYAHLGPRPSPKHSLDRYPDNNGSYEPDNVRWATTAQQQANARDRGPALSLALQRAHREHPGFNGAAERMRRFNRERREATRA